MNIYIFENIYIFKEYLLSWEMCDMSSEISKTRKVCMYTYTHTLTHTHTYANILRFYPKIIKVTVDFSGLVALWISFIFFIFFHDVYIFWMEHYYLYHHNKSLL